MACDFFSAICNDLCEVGSNFQILKVVTLSIIFPTQKESHQSVLYNSSYDRFTKTVVNSSELTFQHDLGVHSYYLSTRGALVSVWLEF